MKRGENTYFAILARHLHSQKPVVLEEKLSAPKQISYYQFEHTMRQLPGPDYTQPQYT
jgi:hypothetical protein